MGDRCLWANCDQRCQETIQRRQPRLRLRPPAAKISVRCETRTRLGLQSSCADNNRRQRLGVHGSRIKSRREEEGESEAGSLGLTCISSSFDWMSGGKSAAPQVNGSNGSAPNRSLSAKRTQASARKRHTGSFNH